MLSDYHRASPRLNLGSQTAQNWIPRRTRRLGGRSEPRGPVFEGGRSQNSKAVCPRPWNWDEQWHCSITSRVRVQGVSILTHIKIRHKYELKSIDRVMNALQPSRARDCIPPKLRIKGSAPHKLRLGQLTRVASKYLRSNDSGLSATHREPRNLVGSSCCRSKSAKSPAKNKLITTYESRTTMLRATRSSIEQHQTRISADRVYEHACIPMELFYSNLRKEALVLCTRVNPRTP
ncbi:hypothetical protein BJ138DRAFT_2248 [Hygrophoropsis aurantiaca]|uniref:Uncharacterized protein n=1 Tax=Hygrophoropsis aurantiaca TaxID=72124 RepID=A0ACB8ATT8_9AGAM|nr:hypothetical protein BJ138DRAFT_2248 [Hygrophoropsis aurantiaca]